MMASAEDQHDKSQELECAYCFGSETEMKDPRRLPCGHVYCLVCIKDDVLANKILQCPKCRRAFDLSPEDLEVYVPGSGLTEGHSCEVCVRTGGRTLPIPLAQVYCITCPKKMCKEHEKSHEDFFPMHTNVISIADFVKDANRLKDRFCHKHKEPLKLACKHCFQQFCVECDDEMDSKCGDKPHHNTVPLGKLAKELRSGLQAMQEKAQKKKTQLQEYFKGCERLSTEFEAETQTLRGQIRSTMESQIANTKAKYLAFEEDFVSKRTQAKQRIDNFINESLASKLEELTRDLKVIDTAVQDGHEVDVVNGHSKYKLSLETLVEQDLPSTIVLLSKDMTTVTKGKEDEIKIPLSLSEEKAYHIRPGQGNLPDLVKKDMDIGDRVRVRKSVSKPIEGLGGASSWRHRNIDSIMAKLLQE